MDSSAEFCGARAEPSIDCREYRASSLMDFYRAERIRVLFMRQGLSVESTASADSRVNASMDDEMEIVNDENVFLERSSVSDRGGRGTF
ncbi:unnamed protein product [Angiostrongylus costaricensis]|uniref:Arf-GAP domain-containing protein n=1 Tax=Angiostrongylus costaricensis TaxID=334426 RepID=A0A0R3PYK9_ANGCS|nr:unnamed protein product [Angiostrongylus costaricensis]